MRVPTDRHPTHPGEVLLEEFVRPIGISAEEIAKVIRASLSEIARLIDGRKPLDAEEAVRLSEYLGTSTRFWVSLQQRYDQYIRL